ncbi:hypothetical protein HDU67_007852 [Dinochytrium kinnereticum]|nr:hypothetical protein HDU67_007852 [Dinochytrium kinnereticum]
MQSLCRCPILGAFVGWRLGHRPGVMVIGSGEGWRRKSSKAGAGRRKRKDPEFITPSTPSPIIPTPKPRKGRKKIEVLSGDGRQISPFPFNYEVIEGPTLDGSANTADGPVVPRLAHGIDRALFSPGVHVLQDPRSKVYNFNAWLQNITQPEDFNFDALPPYVTASKDESLFKLAKTHSRRYASSTSSITSLIAKVYQVVSFNKPINNLNFSMTFTDESKRFTATTRSPTSAVLRFREGVYLIDQEKVDEPDDDETEVAPNLILMNLGKSMEKMLTSTPEEFSKLLKEALEGNDKPVERCAPDAFVFAKVENFLLRSQLDCMDPRLPKRSFDLKTRATLPIRMDPGNYKDYLQYKLKKTYGLLESYEREYYDMVRSAMLKYNFQVRIGNMDGILVCYHNTKEIFGFQYLSIEEMDEVLYGSSKFGDAAFAVSVKMLEKILDKVSETFWGWDVRVTLKGSEKLQKLAIYAEPISRQASNTSLSPPPVEKPPALAKYELRATSWVGDQPMDDSSPTDLGLIINSWYLAYEICEKGVAMKPSANGTASSAQLIEAEEVGNDEKAAVLQQVSELKGILMPSAPEVLHEGKQNTFLDESFDDGLPSLRVKGGNDVLEVPPKKRRVRLTNAAAGGEEEDVAEERLWSEYGSVRRACTNLSSHSLSSSNGGRSGRASMFMRSLSRQLSRV